MRQPKKRKIKGNRQFIYKALPHWTYSNSCLCTRYKHDSCAHFIISLNIIYLSMEFVRGPREVCVSVRARSMWMCVCLIVRRSTHEKWAFSSNCALNIWTQSEFVCARLRFYHFDFLSVVSTPAMTFAAHSDDSHECHKHTSIEMRHCGVIPPETHKATLTSDLLSIAGNDCFVGIAVVFIFVFERLL